MDTIKIGSFISHCRKLKGLTQAELAEKLDISHRAVSKWETGKNLPDASLMIPLTKILGISVNELLSGSRLDTYSTDEIFEKNLLAIKKWEEKKNNSLLHLENVIGLISVISFVSSIFIVAVEPSFKYWKALSIGVSSIIFIIGMYHCLKIERIAGYYRCKHCDSLYVSTFSAVVLARHRGRDRKMLCPHCYQKSWHKKVFIK